MPDPDAATRAATKPRRLTRDEAARVRSLMIDSGDTRAEAEAWVRTFGASDKWFPASVIES